MKSAFWIIILIKTLSTFNEDRIQQELTKIFKHKKGKISKDQEIYKLLESSIVSIEVMYYD